MTSLENFLDPSGFIDIPRIIENNSVEKLFPGILPEIEKLRKNDFPYLKERIYLDSGATSQVPTSVIKAAMEKRLTLPRGSNHSKNSLEARRAQKEFESARETLNAFFKADDYLTIFTGGTTDASNWIGSRFPFQKGDLLLYTDTEHNSQILTARNFAKKVGAKVKRVNTDREGQLNLNQLKKYVEDHDNGKILLNLIHASNVSGIINPINEVREILGNRGFIYLDMAQSAGHIPIDLNKLNVDFASCSAHKMYGPMGMGAMFINKKSERYVGTDISGGSAVKLVSRWFTAKSNTPERYEPGTQNLEGAIEWRLALDYLNNLGMDKIHAHDTELGKYFQDELQKIPNVKVFGPQNYINKVSVITFNIGSYLNKNYDEVARKLDQEGISVRDGCFCAHIQTAKMVGVPAIAHEMRTLAMKGGISNEILKLPGAVRASFAFYNDLNEAYKAVQAIRKIS